MTLNCSSLFSPLHQHLLELQFKLKTKNNREYTIKLRKQNTCWYSQISQWVLYMSSENKFILELKISTLTMKSSCLSLSLLPEMLKTDYFFDQYDWLDTHQGKEQGDLGDPPLGWTIMTSMSLTSRYLYLNLTSTVLEFAMASWPSISPLAQLLFHPPDFAPVEHF